MEGKKRKILLIIAICTFAILVIGSTYAYFQNQYGNASSADLNVLTYTTDVLTFETGDPISIYADASNFKKGESSKNASTFARAILQANNKTNEATANYDVLLEVSNNTLGYTKSGSAELIISIVDKITGNPVTSIDGLTYVTVTDGNGNTIKGFDITTAKDTVTLINNKEISASPKTIEEYTIKVTLVNYDYDQSDNSGKNFSAKLVIKKHGDTSSTLCDSGENFSTCLTDYSDNNGIDLTALYHHTNSLENGASDNSYRYAGNAKRPAYYKCEYDGQEVKSVYYDAVISGYKNAENDCKEVYNILGYSDASLITGNVSAVHWNNDKNECLSADDYTVFKNDFSYPSKEECVGTAIEYLYNGKSEDYVIGAKKVGAGTLVKKYSDASGDVNNYVCMDKDAKECSEDDLFRIIGIFDERIKLVRANRLSTQMAWDTNGSNTWSTSSLNQYLNGEYLESISKFSDKIDTTTWKVGGNSRYKIFKNIVPSSAYQNEVVNPVSTNTTDGATEYSAKIGLMYVTDYYYASAQDKWPESGNYYDTGYLDYADSWVLLIKTFYANEWLLTRESDSTDCAFDIVYSGGVYTSSVDNTYDIRPTFYLKNTVKYLSGTGTLEDPMRFN